MSEQLLGLLIQVTDTESIRADRVELLHASNTAVWFELIGRKERVNVHGEYQESALRHYRDYLNAVEATDPACQSMRKLYRSDTE